MCLSPAAVVTAAGMSRRMGQWKPLLPLGSETVLERTVSSLLEGGAEQVVVVTGYRGAEAAALVQRRFGAAVRCVHNPDYACSDMLRSVQIGTAVLPDCSGFYLLPGDMPFVSPETIASLFHHWQRHPCDVVFPVAQGRRRHPPFLSARLIPAVLHYDGEDGLRGLWLRLEGRMETLEVADPGVLVDLDTPEDYQRWKRRFEAYGTDQ